MDNPSINLLFSLSCGCIFLSSTTGNDGITLLIRGLSVCLDLTIIVSSRNEDSAVLQRDKNNNSSDCYICCYRSNVFVSARRCGKVS